MTPLGNCGCFWKKAGGSGNWGPGCVPCWHVVRAPGRAVSEGAGPRAGAKKFGECRLKCLGGGPGQHVGLAVQCRNQTLDALALKDGAEFRASGRHLADRTIE